MAYDAGLKVGVEGESQFKAAIKNINANIKSLNAALKSSDAAFKGNEKSEQALTQKSKLLQQAIQATKQKVQALATQYEKSAQKTQLLKQNLEAAKAEFGANSKEAANAEIAYNRQAAATQSLAAQHTQAAASLQQLETELADVERESSSAAQAERRAAEAAEELARQQQEAADKVAATSDQLGKGAQAMQAVNQAALAVAAAIGAVTVAATKVGMDFEAQMSKVAAISGATEEDFAALSAKAKEMGATTKFSATESGQALEYMAMAGWKSEQMIAGLPGIMNLAAAAGEDLGTTSDIVTDALTAFNMTADQSGHFADVIAAASSNANTNVSLLGESFKYVGTQAGALGYSAEDVSLALGLMANAGLKGSMSGTALSTMLTRLATNTKGARDAVEELGVQFYNEDGTARDLNSVLKDLRKATANLTVEQKSNIAKTVAGQEAQKGLLAILNAQESDYKKLESAIYSADGAAKRMADTMNDNLKGQLTLMGSALEGAGIAFYEKFQEPLTDAVRIASDKISQFTTMLDSGQLDSAFTGIATVAAGVTAAIVAMNAVLVVRDLANFATAAAAGAQALQAYTAATKAGAAAQGALNLVQSLSPMGVFAVAVAGVAAAVGVYVAATHSAESETDKLSKQVDELTSTYNEYQKQQDDIAQRKEDALSTSMAEINHLQSMVSELESMRGVNGEISEQDKARARVLTEMINEIMPGAVEWIDEQGKAYARTADSLDALIAKEQLKAWLDANQESYQAAMQNQNNLISEITKASDAIEKEQNHLKELQDAQAEAVDAGNLVKFDRLQIEIDETNQKLQEAEGVLDGYEQEYVNSVNTITQYESQKAALLSDDEEQIRAALDETKMNLVQYTGANQKELKQQAADTQANYEELVRMSVKYPAMVTKAQLDEARERASKAKTIAEQAGKEEAAAQTAAHIKGLESGISGIQAAVKTITDAANAEFQKGASKARESGKNFTLGFTQGISGWISVATAAAEKVAGAAASAANAALKIQSPSRVMIESGEYFDLGLAKGIKDNSQKTETEAEKMSKRVLSAATEWMDSKKAENKVTVDSELKFWQDMLETASLSGDALIDVQKKVNDLTKSLSKDRYEESKKWIDAEKELNRLSAEQELEAWERVAKRLNLDLKEQIQAEKQVADKKSEISKASLAASKKWIEEEKYYDRLSAEEEIAAWARVLDRKNLGLEEQLEADKLYYAAQKQLQQDQEKALEEQQKKLEQISKEYENSLKSRVDSLNSYAGIFDKIEKDTKVTGNELLKNLKDQVKYFKDWQADMLTLEGKGITGPLLEELNNLGPAAADQIHALSRMTSAQLDEYAKLYEEKANLIAEQAKIDVPIPVELQVQPIDPAKVITEKDQTALKTAIGSVFSAAYTGGFAEKAALFLQTGANSLIKYTEGLVKANPVLKDNTEEIMDNSVDQVASYKGAMTSTGYNLMLGVASGVASGRSAVVNAVAATLAAAVAAAKESMKIHSPSQVMAGIGDYMAQGLEVGWTRRMKSVVEEIRDSIPVPEVASPHRSMQSVGEGVVNALSSVVGGYGQSNQPIILQVQLDGKTIAETTFDPLREVERRRGVSLG